jgi:hypothetical protein
MRTLTTTLLAAQKSETRTPAVSVQALNLIAGAVNLKWQRLYSGSEPDYYHCLTLTEDGSLIRLRITPPGDALKLYRQRVANPGPASDYSQWTYLNLYNVANCAACSRGSEVSLFWVISNGEIDRVRSIDNGATWQTMDYPGYAPTGAVGGMAAAYKPNGDLALFFGDLSTLYVIKRTGNVWQSRAAWNKTTGNIAGVAVVYADGDWKLLVSGRETDGTFKIWSLVYGDGGEVSAGSWSDLKDINAAPSDGNYELVNIYLDKADGIYRYFYNEKYSASLASNRPFGSHTLPDTSFLDNLWREPVPFETESPFGLALAHTSSYTWLTNPSGVWRADPAEVDLKLSGDILSIKEDLSPDSGELTVELTNNQGQYSTPGSGSLVSLETGCRIDFSPGYRTPAGNEYSPGLTFVLQGYEHISANGKASLILYAADGWTLIENWTARYQFRWNPVTDDAPVKEILTRVLARCGIILQVISQSSAATGFYPDFTIHPGENGKTIINRLLSFIPDVLFIEGLTAYLVDPRTNDAAVYSYYSQAGTPVPPTPGPPFHMIYEGSYRTGTLKINRIKAEGTAVQADSFNWTEINRSGDILKMVEDLNIDTPARAQERGSVCLRKAEMESSGGFIRVPVNSGQQLYDVIQITDPPAGLNAAKRRVMRITLTFVPGKGIYEQKILLGGV